MPSDVLLGMLQKPSHAWRDAVAMGTLGEIVGCVIVRDPSGCFVQNAPAEASCIGTMSDVRSLTLA